MMNQWTPRLSDVENYEGWKKGSYYYCLYNMNNMIIPLSTLVLLK